jgi:hypothetical protein
MRRLIFPFVSAVVFAACSDNVSPNTPKDPGSLLAISMDSTVGVLIDEFPTPEAQARAVADLVARPEAFWRARIQRQIETTSYRLVYRATYFDPSEGKAVLPLPPVEIWKVALKGKPELREIDGHQIVALDYTFTSTLLGPEAQAVAADARLTGAGTSVEESFVLPVDPEHILERTGYACMNEADFPPNSVDTENARNFYDDTCEKDALITDDGCHLTAPIPDLSCPEAVKKFVGSVSTTVRFERLAWDSKLADEVRVGKQLPGVTELRAMPEGVADNRIVYRYFPEDSCAIDEGCVGGPGWRRLLQFTATVQNLGAVDSAIGDVSETSDPVKNRLVSLSACHQHMHFNHYGNFTFGSGEQQLGSKRAFCLESTWRYYNNEDTPFTHPYSCHFQGTAAGWGDDYIAGLDCQWIDVTPVDTSKAPVKETLAFNVNPDKFLCEGTVKTDLNGATVYEVTEFKNEAGEFESRIGCNESAGAADNNVASAEVTLPTDNGGLVTSKCMRGQVGSTKNCGFARSGDAGACTPGQKVTLTCSGGAADKPSSVRVCEGSGKLGAIPCAYRDALGTATTTAAATTVEFTCPEARSADLGETGGTFGVYVAPLLEGDPSNITCEVVPPPT